LHDWIIGDVRNGLFDILLDEGPISWVLELGLRGDVVGDIVSLNLTISGLEAT
jgi:hypothetical protein